MLCPRCASKRSTVYDSRPTRKSIRRRRQCLVCSHRWTTFEVYRTPVMPPKTDEYIRAAITVCRPDFIMAEEQEHVVHCVRFHSRARVVFEGIEPAAIWQAIVRDREQHPGEWEAWRSYWNTGARS